MISLIELDWDRPYFGLGVAMKTLGQHVKRINHRIGWLGIEPKEPGNAPQAAAA